jgi:hypothetical protein
MAPAGRVREQIAYVRGIYAYASGFSLVTMAPIRQALSAEWNRVRDCCCDEYRKAHTVMPSETATVPGIGNFTPVLVTGRLHRPDGLGHRGHGILAQPQGQGEVEQNLRVRGPLDVGVQRRADGKCQVTLHRSEPGEGAVVHEQPVLEPERVTVGLLNRRPSRGADMAKEQRRLDGLLERQKRRDERRVAVCHVTDVAPENGSTTSRHAERSDVVDALRALQSIGDRREIGPRARVTLGDQCPVGARRA